MTYSSNRKAQVSCTAKEFYNFITDIRNFGRFIPDSMKQGWASASDSCTFIVTGVGSINLTIAKKEPFVKVIFNGEALSRIKFTIDTSISGESRDNCEVVLLLNAEMDPLTGSVVGPGIEKLLDVLVDEIGKFSGWRDI